MIYIRIIIGKSLVSIFFRSLASASKRYSGDIAATSGGGAGLACTGRSVAGTASSEISSIAGLVSMALILLAIAP